MIRPLLRLFSRERRCDAAFDALMLRARRACRCRHAAPLDATLQRVDATLMLPRAAMPPMITFSCYASAALPLRCYDICYATCRRRCFAYADMRRHTLPMLSRWRSCRLLATVSLLP